ncbi:hypothetical protein SLEP1_g17376 [Rubroshorea leprosula]|uniref:Late embryogenesis abundant protein LEA-2 subgroup domain-containing protein n=1 Tax=Rubroshorea leprosula TaxID=152421 RepID=A0AAV5J340_9ROSI|nr:hypothetical protein SLEP1_g17376 [Rubroshorea leprosula]
MEDQQKRIHPVVDVKSPPPRPPPVMASMLSRGSATSDKGMLNMAPRPPSMVTVPLVPQGHATSEKVLPRRRQRSCCCKFICWTISLLFVILILIAATAGILYLIFRPKLPKYSINNLNISDLRLNYDLSLYAKFNVKITANNPNEKIGIYYEKGSRLSVWYTNSMLCEGSLPKFYQGHQNITKLDLALTGQNEYGSTIMAALQEQQQTGRIPLELKVVAPVAIKLGSLKLRKMKILGQCNLVVDSLSANNLISIKASNCRFGLKL